MKAIWIISFIFFGVLATTPAVQASDNHQKSKFDRQLDVAYKYPNQLNAAISWRLNHVNLNLGRNAKLLSKFDWHPSVIAVISSPQFGNYVYNKPRNRQFSQQNQLSRNSWGQNNSNRYYNKKRSVRQQSSQRFKSQSRRY